MPQPEEFFEEEEILEDEDTISEEEIDDDDFIDEDEETIEDDDDTISEEEEDEEFIDDEEENEDLSEEYEVVVDAETYAQDLGGGKIKAKRSSDTEDKSAQNKASISSKLPFKGKAKIPDKTDFTMSEHMTAMFDGEELSEDFKNKAVAVFEAAVNERYDAIVAKLEESYEKTIEENTSMILDELANRVNDYISYIAEEWMKENRIAVESGIRSEIADNFLRGIRDIFEQNYIQVPEDKVDLIDEMDNTVDELKNEINEKVTENMELRKQILALRCNDIFESYCNGLADTQIEKLRTLAEGIEFDSEQMFEQKLAVLKESYFGNNRRVRKAAPVSTELSEEVILESGEDEQESAEEPASTNPIMQNYVSALSRKGLKNR
jgi:hypothetical protein